VRDIAIAGDRIAEVREGIVPPPGAQVLEAKNLLAIPGLVSAHYHSHDTLLKGCFAPMPLEAWFLHAVPPNYPQRPREEIRARVLIGALEALKLGITTLQDMATVHPFDEGEVDTILQAYDDIGIRCVFALQITDKAGVKAVPFWEEVVPAEQRKALAGAVEPFKGLDIKQVVRDVVRAHSGRHRRITLALGPTSPERCTPELLESLAELSAERDLPVYSHIYESKAMTLIARQTHTEDDGSLITYLRRVGLLTPKLSLAHSVWMTRAEIEAISAAGTNVVLNPVGNLKTRSGVAPIRTYLSQRVNVGLGCVNCSCSDSQNMFQSMKLFAGLAAVSNPEPGPPTAAQSIWAATVAGARTAGLEGTLGAIKPGMAADLSIIDLTDPSFVPLNSVARQLVFTESGRGVETVIVDGQVVIRNRKITTIDERALREEVADLMKVLRKDIEAVVARNAKMMPYLLEAHLKTWNTDIGLNRYIAGGRD
jgi:guanine deaminase